MSNELSVEYGFQDQQIATQDNKALIEIEQSRAMYEVQAPYIIAKKSPRDELQSFQRIMKACKRPLLASKAMYAYPRGNQTVTGPSIRLAEVLLQAWGNCRSGVRELSQSNGVSVAEAFAVDLETNVEDSKIFHVPHVRFTKKGSQKLIDPRDIYELVANNGSRRKRACILSIIPADVVDAAVKQCEKTLSSGKEPLIDRVRKMLGAFEELGVKKEMLEKRLGHNLDATIESEFVNFIAIHNSIRDGFTKREDWFSYNSDAVSDVDIGELIANKNAPVESVNQTTGEVTEKKPDKEVPDASPEFNKIQKQIEKSKSIDTLDIAGDLIRTLENETEQLVLREFYNQKRESMKG